MMGLSRNRWIGLWIMAVAVIHMAFTPVFYSEEIRQFIDSGLVVEITAVKVAAGVWFFLFGLPLYGLGLLVDWAERSELAGLPLGLPVLLTLTVGFGVFFFPASGFYLLIPAIIALFIHRRGIAGQAGA